MAETNVRFNEEFDLEKAKKYAVAAAAWNKDPEFRMRCESDPHGALSEVGLDFPAEAGLRVVANTREAFHIAFPMDPNTEVTDELLMKVTGGSTAGTAGTIGTVGSAGTVPSTASTVGSVFSAGTAGSASSS